MLLLRSICGHDVSTRIIFTTLRLVMFCISFVLEDWALHELIDSRRQRRTAILLVASSYVTWTWQAHTFSNSIESVLVLWSLVLMKRLELRPKAERSSILAAAVLAFVLVLGIFNRITFPAFVIAPLIGFLPTVLHKPWIVIVMAVVGLATSFLAVLVDTDFYSSSSAGVHLSSILEHPVITPINNLLYNSQASNLALHGTHPLYQHFLINLPQLIGPAFFLVLFGFARFDVSLTAGLCGAFILSLFPHQEARFLLPAVPLVLSSIKIPHRWREAWIAIWLIFNVLLGTLMGTFHQGGIVPAQIYIASQSNITQAFWWKTYSPPTWLLDGRVEGVSTIDLMGLPKETLVTQVCANATDGTVLVAPNSADFLDQYIGVREGSAAPKMALEKVWSYSRHLNLDDLDFGDDGVLPTLRRVVGRRGLDIWQVRCD